MYFWFKNNVTPDLVNNIFFCQALFVIVRVRLLHKLMKKMSLIYFDWHTEGSELTLANEAGRNHEEPSQWSVQLGQTLHTVKTGTPAAAEWHLRFWSHTPDVRMHFPVIFHLKCLLVVVNLHQIAPSVARTPSKKLCGWKWITKCVQTV